MRHAYVEKKYGEHSSSSVMLFLALGVHSYTWPQTLRKRLSCLTRTVTFYMAPGARRGKHDGSFK